MRSRENLIILKSTVYLPEQQQKAKYESAGTTDRTLLKHLESKSKQQQH